MASLNQRLRQVIGSSLGADIVEMNIEKALNSASQMAEAPTTHFFDPLTMFQGREWLVRQNAGLTFWDMRRMAMNPIVQSIVGTRIQQMAGFMAPARGAHDQGFVLVSDDPQANQNTARKDEITEFIMSCGIWGFGDNALEDFCRKFMRDSLVLDQACGEIVNKRNGEPGYFVAVDGATIRLLKRSLDKHRPPGDEAVYAQVLHDRVVATYTVDQMMFGVRHPQTDIRQLGYGQSELETLIRTITTILNADKFNAGQLTQGGLHKGLLVVKGDATPDQFNSFKREFREAQRNAADYWRAPVLKVAKDSDIDWVTLDKSNRDMEYAALFDFLVKQSCGVYQIDPIEINWAVGASGGRQTFENRLSDKIRASHKKGLQPLLRFFAKMVTANIIRRVDDRYRMEFKGLGADRRDDAETRDKEVKSVKTVNEVRQELGLKPLKGGDILLDPEFTRSHFEEFGDETDTGAPGDRAETRDSARERSVRAGERTAAGDSRSESGRSGQSPRSAAVRGAREGSS